MGHNNNHNTTSQQTRPLIGHIHSTPPLIAGDEQRETTGKHWPGRACLQYHNQLGLGTLDNDRNLPHTVTVTESWSHT